MSDGIRLASELARFAPVNVGDPLPTWRELEKIGDVMRHGGNCLRQHVDEIARLRAAILPFADAADSLEGDEGDETPLGLNPGRGRDEFEELNAGHLRAAWRALREKP